MSMVVSNSNRLREILLASRVIAVVGHSDNPGRTSYQIAQAMSRAGYVIFPVNPRLKDVDGSPCFAALADVPVQVDIVNVFRRSEHLAGIVEEAAAIDAKCVWAQRGVYSEQASQAAQQAGIELVMDNCIKVTHQRLIGA